jgi:hypothetical protein
VLLFEKQWLVDQLGGLRYNKGVGEKKIINVSFISSKENNRRQTNIINQTLNMRRSNIWHFNFFSIPLPPQGLVVYFLSLHVQQSQFFADPVDQPQSLLFLILIPTGSMFCLLEQRCRHELVPVMTSNRWKRFIIQFLLA